MTSYLPLRKVRVGALILVGAGWGGAALGDAISNAAAVVHEAAGIVHGATEAFNPFATNEGPSLVKTVLQDVERQPRPDKFDSYMQRLDYIHENLYSDYNTRVQRADEYFGRSLGTLEKGAPSRFKCGVFFEVSQEDSLKLAAKPSFEAEIALPNIEKRWDVVVNTARPGDLPGADPTEINNTVQVGTRTAFEKISSSIGAGIRLTWPPEAYVEMNWGPEWSWNDLQIRPSQSFYYESDEGFGEHTALSLYRWLGRDRRFAVGSVTAGTFSESTDGLEWEQTIKGGFIRALMDERERGENIGISDMARGLGLRYSIFGSDTLITEHLVQLGWRRPLHKEWIYIEIDPGIKWRDERDWAADPFILFGLDFLFWGSPTR